MAYTPTTWITGDTITATAMNKIENGIASAGGALICNATPSGGECVLDKTVQEIYDALESGTPAYITYKYGTLPTDYVSTKRLAPIILVYGYSNSDLIRIVASWGFSTGVAQGTGNYLFGPSVAIFSAGGLDEYPIFYRQVLVNNSYLTSSQSI